MQSLNEIKECELLNMFTLIEELPPYSVGVIASGQITGVDYKTILLPALKTASAELKGLNFLFIMETDFTKFSLGDWLSDIKINARYFGKWNKVAVVSENDGLDVLTKVFGLIASGATRTFTLAELAAAKNWVSAP